MTRRLLRMALVAVLATSSACQIPRFEGPQIQNPPMGFLTQEESFQPRRMFPDLDLAFHTAWVHTDLSGVSVIYVNGHEGALTLEDVVAAQQGVQASSRDADQRFGSIEALTIDGRDAWGWEERIESTQRGLVDVAYRVVVPYDTITFAIEFVSGEPNFKMASPDTLRTIIASFAIGRTTWNLPLIGMIAGAVLLLVSILRTRAKERSTRMRSINLVTFKKDDEEGEEGVTSGGSEEVGPEVADPVGTSPSA